MHVMYSADAVDPGQSAADFVRIDSLWHAFHRKRSINPTYRQQRFVGQDAVAGEQFHGSSVS